MYNILSFHQYLLTAGHVPETQSSQHYAYFEWENELGEKSGEIALYDFNYFELAV